VGNRCVCSSEHMIKDEQRGRRQLLIIYWSIYSFCQDTFPRCPKVLHKEVIVRCPICFDRKTGKKKKKAECDSWEQTHLESARRDATCRLTWLLKPIRFDQNASDRSKISTMYHLNLLKFFSPRVFNVPGGKEKEGGGGKGPLWMYNNEWKQYF